MGWCACRLFGTQVNTDHRCTNRNEQADAEPGHATLPQETDNHTHNAGDGKGQALQQTGLELVGRLDFHLRIHIVIINPLQQLEFRRIIIVVFQDFRLFEDRNVYENIAFAQKVIEAPNRRIRSKVLAILSMVGLLDKYKTNPKQLSGGEQQRVAIARALINQPAILLADEPTGNLDEENSWEIMKLLESANEQGTTVVVVTHNMEIVRAMRKRTITIRDGVITHDVEEGGIEYEI